MKTGITLLLEKFGNNQSAVARAFEVTPQSVQRWTKNGQVPLNRIHLAVQLTGYPIDLFVPKSPKKVCSNESQNREIEMLDS